MTSKPQQHEIQPSIFMFINHHTYHPNQVHVHVIMHELPHLPHCITTHIHQCTFMVYACSWYSNKQNPNKHKKDQNKQNKIK